MSDKIVSLAGAKKEKSKKQKPETTQNRNNEIDTNAPTYCSFCNRPDTQVVKMIKGPGVNICSECTMIAVQYLILEDKLPSNEAQKILDLFWSKI